MAEKSFSVWYCNHFLDYYWRVPSRQNPVQVQKSRISSVGCCHENTVNRLRSHFFYVPWISTLVLLLTWRHHLGWISWQNRSGHRYGINFCQNAGRVHVSTSCLRYPHCILIAFLWNTRVLADPDLHSLKYNYMNMNQRPMSPITCRNICSSTTPKNVMHEEYEIEIIIPNE